MYDFLHTSIIVNKNYDSSIRAWLVIKVAYSFCLSLGASVESIAEVQVPSVSEIISRLIGLARKQSSKNMAGQPCRWTLIRMVIACPFFYMDQVSRSAKSS